MGWLPTDVVGWLQTFGGSFLSLVPEAERGALLAQVRTALAPRLADAAAVWTLDYVRLRFVAMRR